MDLSQRVSNLSPQQRDRFLQKLQQQNIDIFQLPIAPVERKKDKGFPLSFAQERLWIIQQMEPGNTAYNIVRITQLQGNLDKITLEKSIREIIKRHEILRTIFLTDNETPHQVILPQLVIPLETIDLKDLAAEEQNNAIKQVIRRENLYAFDLTTGPLLRTILLECGEYDFLFVMTNHHIITDGTSVRYFGNELAQFYEAFSQGTSPGTLLSPLPIQYVDYACWQRQWLYSQSPFLEKQEQYWLNVFSGEIPVLTLPTDYPRPKMQSFEGTSVVFTLEPKVTNALNQLALNRETTLYIVLVALLNVFLAKISNQEDIIIGTTTTGRRHPQLNHLMGMFVNTLVLRNQPQENKTFNYFLQEVKQQTLKALDNQDYPYEELVEKVLVNRDTSRNPLFDVIFNFYNFDNIGTDELETAGLKMKPYTVVTESSKFDIAFSTMLRNHRLICTWEYCTRLFIDITIRRFIKYFKNIIASITKHPGTKISDVEITPETEKNQLLYDFNDTEIPYPHDKTIHDLFTAQVQQTPDNIALVGVHQTHKNHEKKYNMPHMSYMSHLTYKELNEKSNQLAHLLREKGIKPDNPAAIIIERSIEMIISILGILKAGGAYLPIDPDYPQDRIDYILADSKVEILLTDNPSRYFNCQLSIISCQLSMLNKELNGSRRLNTPPQEANSVNNYQLTIYNLQLKEKNLAYIIYTSGSTGRPKGVLVQHQNVVRLVKNQNFIDCTPNDRLLLTGSLGFDITTFEIWWPLLNGLTLFLVNQNIILNPEKLARVITGNRISILHLIPQLFNQLAAQQMDIFAKLRYFLVGGDRVSPHSVNRLRDTYKHINILHMYGPTENTTFSTFHPVNQNYDITIPIGKPIGNSFAYIFDRWNRLTPIGVPGELVVGGDGVARGYLNNPELTAEKFYHVLKDSQHYHDGYYRSYKSYIIYKTGDLARWLPDGNIEFFGRIDNQIKIRGIRIELGEIEKQLLKHKNIKEAVVDSRDDVLCAYVVMNCSESSQNEKNLLIRELKDHLLSTLPDYMLPTYFMKIENIPLTSSGKIDRKALPPPDIIKTQKYQPPGNEVEKKLVETWESVLGIDNIGINDNFFALGGDSIKSIQVAARMNKAGYKIEMKDILQNKTIARLAPQVKKKQKQELIPVDRVYHTISPQDLSTVTAHIQNHIPGTSKIDSLYPLSPMQNGMLYHSLKDKTSQAYFEQAIFTIEGEIKDSLLENSVNKLLERYDVLRTVFVYEELDEPLQVVLSHRNLKVYYEDISTLNQDETARYLEEFKNKDKAKGFDLSRDMLMKWALFKTGTHSYQLVWTFHHILMDGWCLGILYKELIQIYHSSGNVKPVELETVTPYIEYIKWLEAQDKKTGLKYWQEYLEGFEEPTGLPQYPSLEGDSHLTRHNVTVYEVREYDLVLTPGETSGLQTTAAKNQVTLNNLFRTLWGLLLQKYNNSNDVVFGAVVSGRPSEIPGIEQMVGLFINTIPVRINSHDTYEFPHLLSIVQKNALSSNPYEYLPLAEIQANSKSKRNLIDHIMAFENYPSPAKIKNFDIGTVQQPAFAVKDIKFNEQTNYNFNIIIVPEMPLLVRFSYNARVYEKEYVERVGLHFKNLIKQVLDYPGKKISHLEILSEQEKHRILEEFNQTQTQYPKSKTIHELFARQVQQTPDKIAAATPLPLKYRTYRTDKTYISYYISYKELNEKSNQLAHLLGEKGVKPDTIVGIMIKRSIEMIIGILGILKAGGAYLPIDPDYPEERKQYMLIDSNACILLTHKDIKPSPSTLTLTSTSTCQVSPANLAYIIYTSGTTGNPKGVMVNHFNVVRLVKNTNYVEFRQGDRILQTGALEFDASTFEIWGALLNGLQLHLVSNEIILTAEKLKNIIQKSNITLMWLTAPLFNQLSEQDIEIFRGLRNLLVGGDILSPSHINRLKDRFPSLNIINGYGPTENTTFSTTYLINKIHKRNIPIGKPISNSTAYIVDPRNKISPVGIVGELILGGDGIARGYLNNPELTAEKFCLRRPGGLFSRKPPPWTPRKSFSLEGAHKDYMHPCIHASMQYHFPSPHYTITPLPKYPIYRTGDLARWLPDGNIEFLGRIDQQIKLRGFRIELGEIETQLKNHPAIKEAVVIAATKDHPGEKQLCAYIVSEQVPDITGLREFLAKKIPNYMIPSYFITLDHIPLTPNGKINKNALPEPESGLLLPDKKYLPPGNHIEKILVETWQQVLGVKPVGITDNFFEIGGDSIKVIQIAARLKKYNLDLNIEDLFLKPVIKDLAHSVKKTRRIIHQEIVKGKVPLTPIQQRFFENDFEHKHHFNQAVMLFSPQGFDKEILEKVFTKIVEHHDALRMVYRIEDNQEQHQKHDSKKVNVLQVNQGIQGKLFDLNLVNLKHKEISDDKIEKEIEKEANRIQESIDLKTGPLVKSGLFKTAKGDHLLIVIHHLVVDGISWRILLEDFAVGYQLAQQGKEIKFQEKTDSFKYWAQKLSQYAAGAEQDVSKPLSREPEYWRTIDTQKIDPLPEDYQLNPEKKKNKYTGTITVSLNSRETGYLLRNTHHAYSTEINDILLTALAMVLNQWAGQEKILITLEGHGREPIIKDIDTSRTVGWFTTQYPVLLEMNPAHDLSFLIKHVKETLRHIPNKGIGYGLLRYLTPGEKRQEYAFQLEPEINFNYLGQFQWEDEAQPHTGLFRISRVSPGRSVSPELARNHTLDINGMLLKGQLQLSFTYNTHQYNKKTIETLSHQYKSHLLKIIRHCMNREKTELTPSDLGYSHLSLEDFSMITHHIAAAANKETEIQSIYPLSPMQRGMLFHALKDEKSNAYFEQTVFFIDGEIDKSSLETSANKIIERYDVLRTVFIYEGLDSPLQIVLKPRKIKVYYNNIAHLSETERVFYLEEFKTKDRAKGFDLSRDILIRLSLFKTGTHSYQLVWTFHHILMDGWCLGILYKELIQIYHSPGNVKPMELEAVTPYMEYIKWLEAQDKAAGLKYWQDYLEGFEESTGLPQYPSFESDIHLTRDNATAYEVREYDLVLTPGETSGLQTTAAKNQVTLNNLLRTLWGLLLQKYNNSNDVVFGAVVSGRPSEIPGIEQMVGLFINTIPVRINFRDISEFPHLLSLVQKNAVSSSPYEYLPLAEIQAASKLKRNLIDHIMVFENYPIPSEIRNIDTGTTKQPAFLVKDIKFNEQTNYNFNIIIVPGMPLLVRFSYNAREYEKEFVERVGLHFKNLINQVLDHPGKKISHLEVLSKQEKQRILVEFNQTQTQYPKSKTIPELFARQVEQTPDKIAVIGPSQLKYRSYMTYRTCISYKELNEKSGQLAHLLGEKSVKPDSIVGIMIERSLEMVIGILGILKAGAAYLPIETEYPQERIDYMLKDSGARILVSGVSEVSRVSGGIEIIDLYKIKSKVDFPTHLTQHTHPTQLNLAYIIYTSGTTGKPKGTLTTHYNVIRVVKNTNYINLTEHDRLLQLSNYAFDGSVFDIFGALLNGAALVMIKKEEVLAVNQLAKLIRSQQVTVFFVTTAMFNTLVHFEIDCLHNVRKVLFGGERISIEPTQKALDYLGGGRIIHVYGPTETTVYATYYFINNIDKTRHTIPIGQPIANTTVYILDNCLKLVPINVTGELYIGGEGTARGYLNNPELTEERFKRAVISQSSLVIGSSDKFFPNDQCLMTNDRSSKLYRTGDLVRWLHDGNIEFLGRIDQQIKLRGFRIELSEIETQLKNHPAIKEAIVITTTKDHHGEKQLCAYIVGEQLPDKTGLREFLAKKLPGYMIPVYFITLDHIPLTPNGKIDRKALPHPEILPGKKYIAPSNEIEKKLTKIWSDILGVKEHSSIGIDDNFFELGGHSLNATILTAKIYKTFNTRISLAQVFDSPTIRELSDSIYNSGKTQFISITPIEKKEYYPLSSSQKQFYVMQQIDPRATTYNLPIVLEVKGILDQEKLEKIFQELIQRHEALRTSFSIINQNMVQQVHEEVEFVIEYYDTPAAYSTHPAAANINSFIRPFDLSRAPLLQVGLIKLPKSLTNGGHTSHIFIVNLHHILSDLLSQEILIREFFNLYMGKTLPVLKLQYKDYSHWQNQMILVGEIKKQEKYWLNLFKDGHHDLNIPTDFPRPRFQSFAGSFISFDIDREKAGKLIALAREENATLFMVYLAVTCIFLHKLSGQVDITVGTVVAGRRHPELEPIIGPFVNTLVLRNSPALGKTFRQLLEQVRKQTLDAFDNQDYRFEDLVQKVMPERDTSRNPLFDVMFSFVSRETEENKVTQQHQFLETTGIKVQSFESSARSAKFDLTLSGVNVGLQCGFSMEYCTTLFKKETIQRYIMYIQGIISTVAENPDITLNNIKLATDLEAVTSDMYHQSGEFQF